MEFATSKYDVTFPMFAKIDVNGDGAAPLYEFLKEGAPKGAKGDGSKAIAWNFEKFLVDRQGNVVRRFGTKVTPDEIEPEIRAIL